MYELKVRDTGVVLYQLPLSYDLYNQVVTLLGVPESVTLLDMSVGDVMFTWDEQSDDPIEYLIDVEDVVAEFKYGTRILQLHKVL